MAAETGQVFDGRGNLIGEETLEVPSEMDALEQAHTRLRALQAKGKANRHNPQDLSDAVEAQLQLLGV